MRIFRLHKEGLSGKMKILVKIGGLAAGGGVAAKLWRGFVSTGAPKEASASCNHSKTPTHN